MGGRRRGFPFRSPLLEQAMRIEFAYPPINLIDALIALAVELGIRKEGKTPDEIVRRLFRVYGESCYGMLRDRHHPKGKLP